MNRVVGFVKLGGFKGAVSKHVLREIAEGRAYGLQTIHQEKEPFHRFEDGSFGEPKYQSSARLVVSYLNDKNRADDSMNALRGMVNKFEPHNWGWRVQVRRRDEKDAQRTIWNRVDIIFDYRADVAKFLGNLFHKASRMPGLAADRSLSRIPYV